MMRKINIFLASSITEFVIERMAIENFIRQVSDQFEEHYNVKLQPLLCENFDDAIFRMRKQEEYNNAIRGSELCFFIFFTKAGEYTREEFNVAMEQFTKTGKPKIYTYFKILGSETPDQSLTDFMTMLDKTLGHYYGTFSHIDTVKLRILLSLKLQEMDFLEVKTEEGACVVDGKAVLSLGNVMEFANNRHLAQLRQELARAEEEYLQMKPIYAKGGCDKPFYDRYSNIAARRQTLMDEIEALQKQIFSVSMQMVQDEIRGEITLRQKEAYRLFELGDYEGAMAVLDAAEIDDEFLLEEQQEAERRIARRRKYIREYKTRIEILSAMTDYADRFREIKTCYEKIVPYALQEKIELSMVVSYAMFLHNQNDDALAICESLLSVCDAVDAHSLGEIAGLLNFMGAICHDQEQPDKAEEYILRALNIFEALERGNPGHFTHCLADCLNNAALFYRNQGSPLAEAYQLRALAIHEKLAQENPRRFNSGFATSLNNIGLFYIQQRQYGKAEEHLHRAITIQEALAQENPQQFISELATSLSNIADFHAQRGQREKAQHYFLRAIVIYEDLSLKNPQQFNPGLALTLSNAALFYTEQKQYTQAEEYSLRAIFLWELLTQKNPQRYKHHLATSLGNAGLLHAEQGHPEQAEKYYLKTISLQEELAVENPQRFNADLAINLGNIADLYWDQNRYKKTETFLLRAIAIWEKLNQQNALQFGPDLASILNTAGNFYFEQGQRKKTQKYLLRAIEVTERLVTQNPKEYIPRLASLYFNLSNAVNSRTYAQKALEAAIKYPYHPVCRQIITALRK